MIPLFLQTAVGAGAAVVIQILTCPIGEGMVIVGDGIKRDPILSLDPISFFVIALLDALFGNLGVVGFDLLSDQRIRISVDGDRGTQPRLPFILLFQPVLYDPVGQR